MTTGTGATVSILVSRAPNRLSPSGSVGIPGAGIGMIVAGCTGLITTELFGILTSG